VLGGEAGLHCRPRLGEGQHPLAGAREQRPGGLPGCLRGAGLGLAGPVPLQLAREHLLRGGEGAGDRRRGQAEQVLELLFLFQWDDELMTREAGLARWDAFGSAEKTMHVNPGPHVGIPLFERAAAAAFYRRHLSG
jgi:hypothetical protein